MSSETHRLVTSGFAEHIENIGDHMSFLVIDPLNPDVENLKILNYVYMRIDKDAYLGRMVDLITEIDDDERDGSLRQTIQSHEKSSFTTMPIRTAKEIYTLYQEEIARRLEEYE